MQSTRTLFLVLLTFTLLTISSISTAQTATPQKAPAARTDVYHVHFTHAALGKAAQLGDFLKAGDPKAPMPGHFIVLRHQTGDSWDYVVIEHLGTKATVEAAGNPAPVAQRDASDWHGDTFVNGPSWADFTAAMGIGEGSSAKTAGSVYVVSTYRAAPGHREQLEKMLADLPRGADAMAGDVLMQHLEGGPWTFLEIARYNSYQDFGTGEAKRIAEISKGESSWGRLRENVSFHTDTITDRIAP